MRFQQTQKLIGATPDIFEINKQLDNFVKERIELNVWNED